MRFIAENSLYEKNGSTISINVIKHNHRYYVIPSERRASGIKCSCCDKHSDEVYMFGLVKLCNKCIEDFFLFNTIEIYDNEQEAMNSFNYYVYSFKSLLNDSEEQSNE